jgi:hypothetical protein
MAVWRAAQRVSLGRITIFEGTVPQMTEQQKTSSVSRQEFRETVGLIAVVASLMFVGLQVRQSNLQARAAAYQAIGIATSQYHANVDERTIRLFTEANYPKALERWTLADWDRYSRSQLSGLRMVETLLLQVEQGVLDPDALDQLGYTLKVNEALVTPGFECIWSELKRSVGPSLKDLIEKTLQADRFHCSVDLKALRDRVVLEGASR